MFNRRLFLGFVAAVSAFGSTLLASDEKVILTVNGLGDPF